MGSLVNVSTKITVGFEDQLSIEAFRFGKLCMSIGNSE